MLKPATSQSFTCILDQEYQLLLKDVIRYSNIQRADVTLLEEVEAFLEFIRRKRRELVREQSKLRCTCSNTYKESIYVDSRIKEIERTLVRIEEIDNEFMEMMNWYDNPADKEKGE
ncbi:MAG: hypothetical protein WC121_10905 [Candidatus Kapaibacterium sp.]